MIQGGAQLITFCPRGSVFQTLRIFLPTKPKIDFRTPMCGERTGKRAICRHPLLPESLFSSEALGASRTLALEKIGGAGPEQGPGDSDQADEKSFHRASFPGAYRVPVAASVLIDASAASGSAPRPLSRLKNIGTRTCSTPSSPK